MASSHPERHVDVLSVPTGVSCPRSSVQFLQHRRHVDQAELAAEVADDGGVVEHQQLPDALAVAARAQVDRLQQVAEVQVPEGDAALAPRHQQGLGDHAQTGPAAHLLGTRTNVLEKQTSLNRFV